MALSRSPTTPTPSTIVDSRATPTLPTERGAESDADVEADPDVNVLNDDSEDEAELALLNSLLSDMASIPIDGLSLLKAELSTGTGAGADADADGGADGDSSLRQRSFSMSVYRSLPAGGGQTAENTKPSPLQLVGQGHSDDGEDNGGADGGVQQGRGDSTSGEREHPGPVVIGGAPLTAHPGDEDEDEDDTECASPSSLGSLVSPLPFESKEHVTSPTSDSGEFHAWFHGVVSRQEAERLLDQTTAGTFVVRFSESQRSYSISLSVGGVRVRHIKVDCSVKGQYRLLRSTDLNVFKSLGGLVEHFETHAVSEGMPMLVHPCENARKRAGSVNADEGDSAAPHSPPLTTAYDVDPEGGIWV